MNPSHRPPRSHFHAALLALLGAAGAVPAQQSEVPWDDTLPPGTAPHVTRALAESSRHGEWVDIDLAGGQKLNTWVVYPERKDRAGVVLVIHDIRGMSDWIRAVGDQLAQDGFVAIVPDLLSGKGPGGGGTASLGNDVGQAIRRLTSEEVVARLDATLAYGKALPAANGRTGVIGFCWGGTQSFGYALAQSQLAAAVVYYGSVPGATATEAPQDRIAKIVAPVLGLYAGNDERINATLPATTAAMKRHQKAFETHTFEGAGHGFLHRQDGAEGKNLAAARKAWPRTIEFLRQHLAGQAAAAASAPRAAAAASEAKVRELLEVTGAARLAVEAVLERFRRTEGLPNGFEDELKQHAKPERVLDLLVPIYRQRLDDETIDAALAFYRTPAGRKLLAARPLVVAESRRVEHEWGQQLANDVMIALRR